MQNPTGVTTAPATTTTAPATTTTGAGASTTTTAAPGGGPTVGDVSIAIDPDDGTGQHPHSIQVATDAKLKLTWATQGATGVKIDPLGSFGTSGTADLPAVDGTYRIVAVDDAGAESAPYLIEVHTHEPGAVVSPHVDVHSGVASIVSFTAKSGGAATDTAAPGASVEFEVVASDGVDSVTVDGQDVPLADGGDGHKTGSITLTVPSDAPASVTFTCKAIKGGEERDTASATLTVAAASTTTTASPASTTTANPATTTTAAAGALQNAAWGASAYTHGMPIDLNVDAPGVPDGQMVYFLIESELTPGNWKPLQTAKAQAGGGKASVSVVLKDPDEGAPASTTTAAPGAPPSGELAETDELCRFRFQASLKPFDDSGKASGT